MCICIKPTWGLPIPRHITVCFVRIGARCTLTGQFKEPSRRSTVIRTPGTPLKHTVLFCIGNHLTDLHVQWIIIYLYIRLTLYRTCSYEEVKMKFHFKGRCLHFFFKFKFLIHFTKLVKIKIFICYKQFRWNNIESEELKNSCLQKYWKVMKDVSSF